MRIFEARWFFSISGLRGVLRAKPRREPWKAYKDKEVVFLGVDIQDTKKDARGFIKEFGITYMNGRDGTGRVAIDYGVWGIPDDFHRSTGTDYL